MENKFFREIKNQFGFGAMRLPMKDGQVDTEEMTKMVDAFLEAGFNYFDTAHGYLGGKSEVALRECLTSRYPREAYVLTNKLSTHFFTKEEELEPLFQSQLDACGVDYFDFFLMHAQDGSIYEKYKRCHAYEFALKKKEEGKIRHFGISFHDTAEVLDRILTEQPEIEIVQLQFNYIDYEDPSVQSRKVYEVCEKHGKPVIVMEPVKGGSLAKIPETAVELFKNTESDLSVPSWAIRFAASLPNVMMVLSGMSNIEQMNDNLSYMTDFKPLTEEENKLCFRVADIINGQIAVPCTACSYCVEGCPKDIPIPKYFSLYNDICREDMEHKGWTISFTNYNVLTKEYGKASECIGCGQCERICPQHLTIIDYLKDVAGRFEA